MCQFWWIGCISWHCVENDFEVQWKENQYQLWEKKRGIYTMYLQFLDKAFQTNWQKITELKKSLCH